MIAFPGQAAAAGLPAPFGGPAFLREAETVLARYPRRINALLPVLQLAAGFTALSPEHIGALARWCWATPEQGLLVARAYHLLAPDGDTDRVTFCLNVHCLRNGAETLRDACRQVLHGQPVLLDDWYCFGHCEAGPCVEVNGRILAEATVPRVIAELRQDSPATDAETGLELEAP